MVGPREEKDASTVEPSKPRSFSYNTRSSRWSAQQENMLSKRDGLKLFFKKKSVLKS